MPIHSDKLRLSYFPIPKNGTSTLRAVFHAVEAGESLENVRTRGDDIAASLDTAARGIRRARREYEASGSGYERLMVVRDPLRRFFSGFDNKIRSGRLEMVTGAPALPDTGLPTRPDIDTFVTHLDQYRAESHMIRKHFRLQSHFTGDELGWFDHLFRLERFDALADFLTGRLGAPIAFPHEKRSDKSWTDSVPAATVERIREVYARDYDVLGTFLAPAAQV